MSIASLHRGSNIGGPGHQFLRFGARNEGGGAYVQQPSVKARHARGILQGHALAYAAQNSLEALLLLLGKLPNFVGVNVCAPHAEDILQQGESHGARFARRIARGQAALYVGQ